MIPAQENYCVSDLDFYFLRPDVEKKMPIRRLGQPSDPTAMRLLCLPPAGAGASIYFPLMALDSPSIEICPISLPGREDRFREPLPTSIHELAQQLARDLAPELDRSYAILGYSMGAILGFEMIQLWRNWGCLQPQTLIALAARPPQVRFALGIHDLSEEAFRNTLLEMGGTPAEVLSNDEAMEIYSPIIRCDFRNCDNYQYQPQVPIDCPIQVFVSDCDPLVSVDHAQQWQECTNANFTLELLENEPHIIPHETLKTVVQKALAHRP